MDLYRRCRMLLTAVFSPRIYLDRLRKEIYPHFPDGSIIGDFTYGTPTVHILGSSAKLRIGKYCSIALGVNIILGGHRIDWVTTYPFPAFPETWPEAREITGHPQTRGDVVIGNDVWLGFGATIISGVNIGDGAVIGAMSVVTKDVDPYSIIAGNPAQEVGKRFDEETIAALLQLQWWDWPERAIRDNIHLLCDGDIDSFIMKNNSI